MNQESKTLSPRIILILRFVWVALFVILAAVFILGVPERFEELSKVCLAEPCIVLSLKTEEAQALADLGLSMSFYGAYHVGIEIAIGGFVSLLAILFFWRLFNDPMGILMAFMLILFGLNFMVESDASFYQLHPEYLPVQNITSALPTIPIVLLIFLFPDGRFVPHWNQFVVLAITLVAILDPLILKVVPLSPSGQYSIVLTMVVLTGVLIGVGSQIYRFRSISNSAQKQQTKWVLVGFLSLLVPIVGWTIFFEILTLPPGRTSLIVHTLAYGVMAIFLFFFPLSFVIAIMRYRLWDIDLLIRRTLVYSILTGTLVMVYFGSVVVVQTIFNALAGQEQSSQLTIALSTLVIAALFNPLRRRVQAFIDRRFYRRSYNAQQVLAQFAATAQDQVAMEQLTQSIHHSIKEALQPATVSIWLHQDRKSARNG